MSTEYKNNHYVPKWYQKRFLRPNDASNELLYLALNPGFRVDPRGVAHIGKTIKKQGIRRCFSQNDLYTIKFGITRHTEIERGFFGQIDKNGQEAVQYFADFDHLKPSWRKDTSRHMVLYMSAQKLRTPKGLAWLTNSIGSNSQDLLMRKLLEFRQLFCAIWTECIWQIADASQSDTKFIISDHPVTVYNRFLKPSDRRLRLAADDPDITLNATHTIFPLSIEKILILTNLSWVRNPYQSGIERRPHPTLERSTMFNYEEIQTLRQLNEQEVREINFIIKSRAYQYIAAAEEEWLYPERYVSELDWGRYGDELLLMPDPRSVPYRGVIMNVLKNGQVISIDEYGRTPGHPDYRDGVDQVEFNTLQRFQGEFAQKFGPSRRGRAKGLGGLDPECDSSSMHKHHLDLVKPKDVSD